MGPSLTGKPEGEGCKGKTWWENEKCAYSFQDDEEKSRWFSLTLEGSASSDLGVLIWEGKPEPLASCLCVARLLGRQKEKLFFSHRRTSIWQPVITEGRRWDRDISVRAQWVASARKTQPNRLYQRNFRFPSKKVQGQLSHRNSWIQGPRNRCRSSISPFYSLPPSLCSWALHACTIAACTSRPVSFQITVCWLNSLFCSHSWQKQLLSSFSLAWIGSCAQVVMHWLA